MGNGDTSSGGGYDNIGGGAVARDNDSGEAATAFLESDVGLGMNMQSVSSYHFNKMTNFMPTAPYFHHDHLHKHQASTDINGGLVFGNQTSINNQIPSAISLEPCSGSDTGGKVLFTATQWQELERQTMIYKYIMASVPVPPQLLIPLSTQSNKVGIDLRFSSGSDPEPWRCRRTDGKKWRCSRDVAPDQKYCERHAHKSRPRSRKLVEIQPHNTD
ncbi:growth-regulating factor 3-like, partial [Cynara cardunculus var. scolymus]|uniref:growth-regulating factor 3-like n=1 Tax=Cynara cardunculus var. scolymus TaxID=59895 RepID=UPI000D6237D9